MGLCWEMRAVVRCAVLFILLPGCSDEAAQQAQLDFLAARVAAGEPVSARAVERADSAEARALAADSRASVAEAKLARVERAESAARTQAELLAAERERRERTRQYGIGQQYCNERTRSYGLPEYGSVQWNAMQRAYNLCMSQRGH